VQSRAPTSENHGHEGSVVGVQQQYGLVTISHNEVIIDDLSNKWIVNMDDGFNTIQLDEVNFIRRLLD
jgi:hypothetical protein